MLFCSLWFVFYVGPCCLLHSQVQELQGKHSSSCKWALKDLLRFWSLTVDMKQTFWSLFWAPLKHAHICFLRKFNTKTLNHDVSHLIILLSLQLGKIKINKVVNPCIPLKFVGWRWKWCSNKEFDLSTQVFLGFWTWINKLLWQKN